MRECGWAKARELAEAEIICDICNPHMSGEERIQWVANWLNKIQLNQKHREKMINDKLKEINPELVKYQLITLSIDKSLNESEAIAMQNIIIQKIKAANYKCLDDVKYRYEYYGENGWNPHIHIITSKIKPDSVVAQTIRRKLSKGFKTMYNMDVLTLNQESAKDRDWETTLSG